MLYQQPQCGPLQVDPSSVGLRNIFAAVSLSSPGGFNAATNKLASTNTSAGPVTRSQGAGLSFTGNTLNRLEYANSVSTSIAYTKFTAMAVFIWRAGGANNFPQLCAASSSNNSFRIGDSAGSGGTLGLVKGGVGSLSTVSVSDGVPYAMVCSHDQASGDYYIILRNLNTGAITSATQTSTSVSSASASGSAVIGNARTDFSGAWNGEIFDCVMAFDYLSRAQGEAWLRNPYAIYVDQDEEDEALLFAPAAVGAYALAAGSGSFAFAGAAIGLKVGRKLSAASGAYLLTGAAAFVAVGRKLAAAAGSYALSGTPAGLAIARRLTASAGTFTMAGSAVGLLAARRLSAGTGTYALSGKLATLTYTPIVIPGAYTLTASSGSFEWTGAAIALKRGSRMGAAPGAFALTGNAASLLAARRLAAAVGTFAITGGAVVLGYSSHGITYTRAPAGAGYAPQRTEYQSRPADVQSVRPADIQRNYR